MWGDIGTNDAPDPMDTDEGFQSLMAMVPEDKRAMGEPMLKGFFSQIKAQLSPADYAVYCQTLKNGYLAYAAGDHETAKQIIESLGLPYEMLAGQLA
jgi:hypothetical protein